MGFIRTAGGVSTVLFLLASTLCAADATVDSPAAGDRPIDLLKLIDPARNAVAGDWKLDGKTLVTGDQPHDRLEIPFDVPAEYRLTVVVQCHGEHQGLDIGLVAGARQVSANIDGTVERATQHVTSLFMIDEAADVDENGSLHRGPVLKDDAENVVVCQVRANQIAVECSGEQLIDWRGDFNRLSIGDQLKMPNPRHLFLGSWDARFRISRIELTPLKAPAPPAVPEAPKIAPELQEKIDKTIHSWKRSDLLAANDPMVGALTDLILRIKANSEPDAAMLEAAEQTLVQRLPSIGSKLTANDAVALLEVYLSSEPPVSTAIENAWSASRISKGTMAEEIKFRFRTAQARAQGSGSVRAKPLVKYRRVEGEWKQFAYCYIPADGHIPDGYHTVKTPDGKVYMAPKAPWEVWREMHPAEADLEMQASIEDSARYKQIMDNMGRYLAAANDLGPQPHQLTRDEKAALIDRAQHQHDGN